MSSGDPNQDALYEEANRLYWESDQSVNQIGEILDLSKGVLYGLIAALPANLPCPGCREEMVFPHRTARDKGFLACPSCGMEEEEPAVRSYWEEEGEPVESSDVTDERAFSRRAGDAVQGAVQKGRDTISGLSPSGRVVAGTALLGIAAGIALGTYFRRR